MNKVTEAGRKTEKEKGKIYGQKEKTQRQWKVRREVCR